MSLGFASVYIARQEEISSASLTAAGFFFALYLVAHVVARYTVPHADPYLLPIAGLLTAVGLTEIYRLDDDDAFRQGRLGVVGVGIFAGTSDRPALRLPPARVVQVPLRDRLDRAADAAGAAGDRRDGERCPAVGARRLLPVPAGRAGQDPADRLPRRLPAREARGAGAGTHQGLRAAARDLGRRHARARPDERPRQRAPLLRDLPGDALRRHRPGALSRPAASRSSSPARWSSTASCRGSRSA